LCCEPFPCAFIRAIFRSLEDSNQGEVCQSLGNPSPPNPPALNPENPTKNHEHSENSNEVRTRPQGLCLEHPHSNRTLRNHELESESHPGQCRFGEQFGSRCLAIARLADHHDLGARRIRDDTLYGYFGAGATGVKYGLDNVSVEAIP
jgi:hypothetical protein